MRQPAEYEHVSVQATEDKNAAVAQADRTAAKAKLADRLITGLSGEFARWTATIEQMAVAEGTLLLLSPAAQMRSLQPVHGDA